MTAILPGLFSNARAALHSCAIEGDTLAIQILETVRRIEAREPVGELYVLEMNDFMRKYQ